MRSLAPFPLLLSILLCGLSQSALADVYKCVDANGRITYTNDPAAARGCSKLDTSQAVSTVPAPARGSPAAKPASPSSGSSATSASGSFPRVSPGAQRSRDDTRRDVLQTELANEQRALETAEAELAEQDAVRLGSEQNYQKKLDRLQPFQDRVDLHRRNIEALNKELQGLR